MTRTIHEILMALHTIPTKMEGKNPMDRVNNAEIEINKIIKNKEVESFNEGCAFESKCHE